MPVSSGIKNCTMEQSTMHKANLLLNTKMEKKLLASDFCLNRRGVNALSKVFRVS